MNVTIDLSGLKTREQILFKFGGVFEFGGPNGNVPIQPSQKGKGWGLNWDALNDSMRHLENGGVWGTSKTFSFPLKITALNCGEFQESDPTGFDILKEILHDKKLEYLKKGKILTVEYL